MVVNESSSITVLNSNVVEKEFTSSCLTTNLTDVNGERSGNVNETTSNGVTSGALVSATTTTPNTNTVSAPRVKNKRTAVDKQYIVSNVLGMKRAGVGRASRLYYLIEWKGKQEKNWVDYARLNCDDIIANYEARKWKRTVAENKENSSGNEEDRMICNDEDEKIDEPYGWNRGLEAECVVGATEIGPKGWMLLVKWKTHDGSVVLDVVPSDEANVRIPQLVIKFYEQRIRFNHLVFSDDEAD